MEFIVVDDSMFDLFTQEKLLFKAGLATKVTAFPLPQLALDYLGTLSGDIPETVLLLDLQMPEMNGFEFTEKFGSLPADIRGKIRVIMISSTVDSNDIEEAAANQYIIKLLSKPLDIAQLRELLHQ